MDAERAHVAVIGAGPAGMAAAAAAARAGADTVLLDDQPLPGGQIYRNVTAAGPRLLEILGADYAAGRARAEAFAASGARHLRGAAVWQVSRDQAIDYLHEGGSRRLQAAQVVVCTGALERPFPIPGWTLPGVMTAGAAQILLKSGGIAAAQPVVLAGCGPLLYVLGAQYAAAGAPLRAVVDTTAAADYARALPHLPGALAAAGYLRKGLAALGAIRRTGVPFYTGATALAVEGNGAAAALRFRAGGREHRIEAPLVLLHQGVVPNTQVSWSLRASHDWSDAQLCWLPRTGRWGELDVPGFYVAGDNRGIAGAAAAALQGELAGLRAAHAAGRLAAAAFERAAAPLERRLRAEMRIRPFLEALYRPKRENRVPAGEVIACRCEEVTAGAIRGYVRAGCVGPNQTKSFGRCGMGPCQGQQCGLTVTELIAAERGVAPAEVGYYRIRPPLRPVTLGELAAGAGPPA
jgi:NADPH-dependent 2,4-dienoyl-CoA reductase/sulfur reductase-like enzyme